MLVGGGMKNNFGFISPENIHHSFLISDIANNSFDMFSSLIFMNFDVNIIQIRFSLIKKHHEFRIEIKNLANQFASYRTCSTGNQYRLSRDIPFNYIQIQFDGIALQEILNLYLFNLLKNSFSINTIY